jgi:hypothetical protein
MHQLDASKLEYKTNKRGMNLYDLMETSMSKEFGELLLAFAYLSVHIGNICG